MARSWLQTPNRACSWRDHPRPHVLAIGLCQLPSEPAETFLIGPVKRQGLADEPFEGQLDRLGSLEDGALDPGGEKGQRRACPEMGIVMSGGARNLVQRDAASEGAGPAMRIRQGFAECRIGSGNASTGNQFPLDTSSPQ